ncbi:MAG: helix-turn-helix domain-containing protein [Planctomycetota bacterium]
MAPSPKSADDFASTLKAERLRADLTQADLASRSDLTAAYISQLESRKKPPPSDEVIQRIAKALSMKADRLLELAHLEKTPKDVRRKYRLLDARLRRQRKITRTLLDDMLPLTLFNFMRYPGYLDRASGARSIGKSGHSILAKLRDRIGKVESFREFRKESREAINGLAEDEREALVETLQAMATWEGGVPRGEGAPEDSGAKEIPVFDVVPPSPTADHLDRARGFLPVVPSRWKKSRWALAVSDDAMFPKLERGDLLVLDDAAIARNGDIVALITAEGESMVGRYMKLKGEIEITPANPNHPPRRFPRGRDKAKTYTLRGVGVEVIRTLLPG